MRKVREKTYLYCEYKRKETLNAKRFDDKNKTLYQESS